jgi:hypothetical protein
MTARPVAFLTTTRAFYRALRAFEELADSAAPLRHQGVA